VRPEEAGVASGLINTSQQIGGAIGVAIATTVATSFTRRYVDDHARSNAFSGPALTQGFQIAFYVLAGLAAAGALISVLMLESRPAQPELQPTSEAFEPEEA
jgi:sugar phosphate permease